jgi:hypothetical protein
MTDLAGCRGASVVGDSEWLHGHAGVIWKLIALHHVEAVGHRNGDTFAHIAPEYQRPRAEAAVVCRIFGWVGIEG